MQAPFFTRLMLAISQFFSGSIGDEDVLGQWMVEGREVVAESPWSDTTEFLFLADGTYQTENESGTWKLTGKGKSPVLHLTSDASEVEHVLAIQKLTRRKMIWLHASPYGQYELIRKRQE